MFLLRVLVSGGGTGGHIYPALATIKKIKELEPNSEFLYIGVEGKMECEIVPKHGINFKSITISGLSRKNIFKNIKPGLQFIKSYFQVKKMIKNFKPDVAFSTGGYVTGPVMYAASRMKVPTVILEQDAALGLANRFLSRYVDTICYVFDSGVERIKELNIVKTGNPASENALHPEHDKPNIDGINYDKKILLMTGGSLGAQVFEKIVKEKANQQFDYQVIYVTGKKNYDRVSELEIKNDNILVVPYIDDMPSLLQHVDLIVGRAGATSITENLALGIPSIIVPYPNAGNNEQLFNALDIESKGACICLEEKKLNTEILFDQAENILFDQDLYQNMVESAKKLGIRDSAFRVYQELKKVMKV